VTPTDSLRPLLIKGLKAPKGASRICLQTNATVIEHRFVPMTDVMFYVLAATTAHEQNLFLCRLTEKILSQGKSTYIHTRDQEQAIALDQLLWTWRPHAFVPHALITDSNRPAHCPVLIGWEDNSDGHGPVEKPQIMINMGEQLPAFFSRFERLLEIVIQDDQVLECTRKHFRYLRDRGYPVTHQDMRERA
jgi:DNA polymerase III subunit chi